MSYQVLARKWRPQTYADVVGQQHVLTALTTGFTHGRLHHAYLFSGTRGVGKTTIARLLAKGLNCAAGITATPCGQCSACSQIEQGCFVDLLEIDAASRTKVEDTREVLDNIQYAPTAGRFKIYLIDEVHMLSRHSFNALLKTLEEPPAHVKFLLATTDPHKLPVTVLSRCLHFHLQPLSIEKMSAQLEKIVQREAIPSEPGALRLLAQAAEGSLRDALSLTDQAIALGQGTISTLVVNQMLGLLDSDQSLKLIEALQCADAAALLQLVTQAAERGCDWERWLVDITALLHRITLTQLLPATLNQKNPDTLRIQALARSISPQDLQLYYQIFLIGRKELPLAPDHRMGVEMTLLRALAFHPQAESDTQSVSGATVQTQLSAPKVNNTPNLPSVALTPAVPPPQRTGAQTPLPKPSSSPRVATALNAAVTPPPTDQNGCSAQTQQLLQARQQLRQQRKAMGSTVTTAVPLSSARGKLTKIAVDRPTEVRQQALQTLPQADAVDPTGTDSVLQANKQTLAAQAVAQSALRDSWSAEIARLTLPKMVEQLALNSIRELREPGQIWLHLRYAQRHLNTVEARSVLSKALSQVAGVPITVTVVVEEDKSGQTHVTGRTPSEWRQAIGQEQLMTAHQVLLSDPHVQALQNNFAAELDEKSIQPCS